MFPYIHSQAGLKEVYLLICQYLLYFFLIFHLSNLYFFLLLFDFERKYFDKENIPNTFVGHPLLEKNKSKVDISHISRGKKIISIFSGSRMSELKVLLPILIEFIKLMNKK